MNQRKIQVEGRNHPSRIFLISTEVIRKKAPLQTFLHFHLRRNSEDIAPGNIHNYSIMILIYLFSGKYINFLFYLALFFVIFEHITLRVVFASLTTAEDRSQNPSTVNLFRFLHGSFQTRQKNRHSTPTTCQKVSLEVTFILYGSLTPGITIIILLVVLESNNFIS